MIRIIAIALAFMLHPNLALAVCPKGGAPAFAVKPAPAAHARLPVWEAGENAEFEKALLATCKDIESIDKVIDQLKSSKAVYWIHNSEKVSPNRLGDTEPYIAVLITPTRSLRIYFSRDTRAVKATRIVNTYF